MRLRKIVYTNLILLFEMTLLLGQILSTFKVQYNFPCTIHTMKEIQPAKEFLIFCDPIGPTSLSFNTLEIKVPADLDSTFIIKAQRPFLPASAIPLDTRMSQLPDGYLFHFSNGTNGFYDRELINENDVLLNAKALASSSLRKPSLIFFATFDPANIIQPTFHQYDVNSKVLISLILDHKVDSICHRKNFILNEIFTTSIDKKRMVIDYSKTGPLAKLNQVVGLYAEQDSIQPETSLGNYFIAASSERDYLIQVSTTDLSDMYVIASTSTQVKCSFILDIFNTEFFIVHGVDSESFLVAEHQSTRIVFMYKEPLLNGPVSQMFTFEKSRVIMAVSGNKLKIVFYKIEEMECSQNCTSCSSLDPNYVDDGCSSCISGTSGFQVASTTSSTYNRCSPCNLGCNSCFESKINCYAHCNSIYPSLTMTDCSLVNPTLGCELHLDSSEGKCLTCDLTNNPSLFFYKGICKECDPSCDGCQLPSLDICIRCSPGYFMGENSKCFKCHEDCSKCFGPDENQCYECKLNRSFAFGKCSVCSIYCDECFGESQNSCISCRNPTTSIQIQSTCHDTINCTFPCLGCESQKHKCTLCVPGYIKHEFHCSNTCPIPHCLKCRHSNACTFCEPGYYIDDTNNCKQCDNGCKECKGPAPDECIECNAGNIVSSGYCWDQVTCHGSCLTCRGPRKNDCLTCSGIQILIGNECSNGCDSNCKTCFGPGSDRCLTCFGTKTIFEGQCIQCAPNCERCNSPLDTDCSICKPGFILIEQRCLISLPNCHIYCSACYGTSASECLDCNDGYSFYDNTCYLCHPSCNVGACSGPLSTDCEVNKGQRHGLCLINTVLNGNSATECIKCRISDPTIFQIGSTCYQPSNQRQPKCVKYCNDCYGKVKGKCKNCWALTSIEGTDVSIYNWGGNCKLEAENCLERMDGQCAGCQPGFRMIEDRFNGNQYLCYPINNNPCDDSCQSCEIGGDPETCISCKPNHTLLNGICHKCHSNCVSCYGVENKHCLTCSPGRKLFKGLCFTDCDPACGVDSCFGPSSKNCLTCSPGYTQTGTNCQNSCHPSCVTCYSQFDDGCSSCLPGQTLLNGICHTCPPECNRCEVNYDGVARCLDCPPGLQFLTVNDIGWCIQCHADCNGCFRELDNTACHKCSDPVAHQYSSKCLYCHPSCLGGCSESNNADACYSCIAPLQQVQHIDADTGVETNRCVTCHHSCKTCRGTSSQDCASCNTGFSINPNGTCQQCHSKCLHCSGPGIGDCSACQKGFVLVAGQCRQCHSSCLSCFNSSPLSCTRCNKGHTRVNNVCVKCDLSCLTCFNTGKKHCTDCFVGGTYFEEECHYCHESCLTCKGNTNTDCLSCIPEKSHLPDEFMCVETCSSGYYYDLITSQCELCARNCKECTKGTMDDCTECALGYENINNYCTIICGDFKVRNALINECTDCHPSCHTCSTNLIGDCIQCSSGREKYNGICEYVCKANEFRDITNNGECKKCHSLCETCTERTVKDCQTCYKKAVLIESENYCKPICTDIQWVDLDVCKDCHPSCKTCQGDLESQCLTCFENEDLINEECICDTTKSLYKSTDNGKCLKCDTRCSTCTSGGLKGCSTCSSDFYLNQPTSPSTNGEHMPCLIDCPPNSFTNEALKACIVCHSSCNTCSGITEEECLSCPTKKILFENKCLSFCPLAYFKDQANRICKKCGDDCESCLNNKFCLKCESPYFLQDSFCLNECLHGHGSWTNPEGLMLCQKCSPGCTSCPGGQCSSCQLPLFFFNNTCVAESPEGYNMKEYSLSGEDTTYKKCSQAGCPKNCQECISATGYCTKCKERDPVNKIPFVLFDGSCLSCIKYKGLKLEGDKCSEICGDGILLSLKKDSNNGNSGIDSDLQHQCDDKNEDEGDGCSSDCLVEKRKVCSRQGYTINLLNYKKEDRCKAEVKISMMRNMNIFEGVSILLRFSRKIQNFDNFEKLRAILPER